MIQITADPRLSVPMKNKSKFLAFVSFLLLCLVPSLPGCAVLALSALGAGAGAGIPYVMTDCADRTLNYSYAQVNQATPRVLRNLDISMLDSTPTKNGEKIKALASELDITIEMEKITEKATRVTVNVTKNTVVKDKATAEEIINQFEKILTKKLEGLRTELLSEAKSAKPKESVGLSSLGKGGNDSFPCHPAECGNLK